MSAISSLILVMARGVTLTSSQTRVLIVLRKPRDWSPPKRGFFFPTPIVRVPGRKAGQLSTWSRPVVSGWNFVTSVVVSPQKERVAALPR